MLCVCNVIFTPERPAKQKDAGQDDPSRTLLPPGADVLLVSNKECPLLLILYMEVIINRDLVVLPRVSLCQLLNKLFVFFCR